MLSRSLRGREGGVYHLGASLADFSVFCTVRPFGLCKGIAPELRALCGRDDCGVRAQVSGSARVLPILVQRNKAHGYRTQVPGDRRLDE